MIKKLIAAHRKRKDDRFALETYRGLIAHYDRWFASYPGVCAVLNNMRGLAENENVTVYDVQALRTKVRILQKREILDYMQDMGINRP